MYHLNTQDYIRSNIGIWPPFCSSRCVEHNRTRLWTMDYKLCVCVCVCMWQYMSIARNKKCYKNAVFTTSLSGTEWTWSTCCDKGPSVMTNGPIRAKHVNRSSPVIGWQSTGQASTRECTVVMDRFYRTSVHFICTELYLVQAKYVHQ